MAVGALGYLTKAAPIETIITAIRKVAANTAYFSEEVRTRLIIGSGKESLSLRRAKTKASQLNHRETQVVGYVARGLSGKENAKLMCPRVRTVENHRTNLMKKLDIHKVSGLVRFAIRSGLVEA